MEHFAAIPKQQKSSSTLANRKSRGGSPVQRTDSFSKATRKKSSITSTHSWIGPLLGIQCVVIWILLCSFYSYDHHRPSTRTSRHLSVVEDASTNSWSYFHGVQRTEDAILKVFNGDARSLRNGIPHLSTERLTERLVHKMTKCSQLDDDTPDDCTLRVIFVGSAQTSGRDVFYNETFPHQTERRLRPLALAAGLKLEVLNHAQDNDLGREGPQKTHMCLANLARGVDVLAWDLDETMGTNPSAQLEAFVRWALMDSNVSPAMILLNRGRDGGPHGLSRRGTKKRVVEVGEGHIAEVYEDDLDDIPEPRQDPYIGSNDYNKLWKEERNSFWIPIMEQYAPFVDFAAVDPGGSIWYLDHLKEFSNGAFDWGKVLPLLDCEDTHPAPCNQIPHKFARKLKEDNVSLESFSKEAITGGAVCSQLFGCRHIWYGGTRSHELRGELNALPIVRAFGSAVQVLAESTTQTQRALSSASKELKLPPPIYCLEKFCNRVPTCITSYLPNRGPSLGDVLRQSNPIMPRMGVNHFGDDPEWAVQNIEKRLVPLGYRDRKYAYRLTLGDGVQRLRQAAYRLDGTKPGEVVYEPADVAEVSVSFESQGAGPLVVCEPPCFSDNCAKLRRMPLLPRVALLLDGQELEAPPKNNNNHPVEVTGALCRVVADEVLEGNHTLQIKSLTKYPHYVLFSHVIVFS